MAGRQEKRVLEIGDYDLMQIPAALRATAWADFDEHPKREVIASYLGRLHEAVQDGDNLLIGGPPMSGKSYLSAFIAKVFRQYSYTVLFAQALEIQDRITEKQSWYDEGPILDRFRNVNVLVVDAYGSELDAIRGGRNRVKELIEHRTSWHKTTIINTNKTPSELNVAYYDGYAEWLRRNYLMIPMQKIWAKGL